MTRPLHILPGLRIGGKGKGGSTWEETRLPHKLQLNERKSLTMTGVTEVVSFDENTVVLQTALGLLIVQGQQLSLQNLSLEGGQVAVEGTVSALSYEEPRQGGWRRLFR